METINKVEQLARIHANCKIENGLVLVTIPEFGNLSANHAYRIIETGDEVKVTAKRSGDGSGKKTIYIGEVNGKPFEGSIEDLKNDLNITYRRPKSTDPKTAILAMYRGLMELAKSLDALKIEAEGLDATKYDEFYIAFDKAKSLANDLKLLQTKVFEEEKAKKEKSEKSDKKVASAKKTVANLSVEEQIKFFAEALEGLTPEQRKALGF